MPFIDREGVRIHYTVDGDGPPVLLTHGFCATSLMWDAQVAALADRYRLIRWDMRGHGRSDSPPDPALYSHELTVADMVAVLDVCDVPRAVIGGLSLGGFMSMLFHVHHPERTRSLVLMDTGPGYRSAASRASWNDYAERQATALEAGGESALSTSAEVNARNHLTLDGLIHVARRMLIQADSTVIDSLVEIDVPVLLLAGADDKPFLDGMFYMSKKIHGGRYEVIEGAGHAVNIDQSDRVNRLLGAFLAGLPA
jgi:pimeloyl-ACP methyl ester carboxylesterase